MATTPAVQVDSPNDESKDIAADTTDVFKLLKTPADCNLEKEYSWLEQLRCAQAYDRLIIAVKELGKRLYCGQKMDPRLKMGASDPRTERLQLASRSGGDAVKSVISLLADNVIACEITLKHSKSPGGYYRGVAQPEVQWKLQQLQDVSNMIARASFLILEAQLRIKACVLSKKWDRAAGAVIHQTVRDVRNALLSARNALVLPRKRTLLELCQFPPTKKFSPAFPLDQIVSIYVSGTRLICAVYQVNTKPTSGNRDVGVVSCECVIPGMPQVLQLLNGSLHYLQGFVNALDALEPKYP